jgi:hypothetical protein
MSVLRPIADQNLLLSQVRNVSKADIRTEAIFRALQVLI